MYFRDPKKELPKLRSTVLVKLFTEPFYYVCTVLKPDPEWEWNDEVIFVDALGNGTDLVWSSESVLGWLPIEELDSIETK